MPPSFKFIRPSVNNTFHALLITHMDTLALFVHFSSFVSLVAVSEYKAIQAHPLLTSHHNGNVLHIFSGSLFSFFFLVLKPVTHQGSFSFISSCRPRLSFSTFHAERHGYIHDLPADHFLDVTKTRNSAVADKPRDTFNVILSNLVVLCQTLLRSAWKKWFLAFGLSRSLKVIGTDTDRSAIYDFLLLFYSNFVPEIFDFKNDMTLKPS